MTIEFIDNINKFIDDDKTLDWLFNVKKSLSLPKIIHT